MILCKRVRKQPLLNKLFLKFQVLKYMILKYLNTSKIVYLAVAVFEHSDIGSQVKCLTNVPPPLVLSKPASMAQGGSVSQYTCEP
jgi:hypothetical protein